MRQSSGQSIWLTKKIDRLRVILPAAFRFGAVGLLASATHLAAASGAVALGVEIFVANMVGFLLALVVSLVGHHSVSFPGPRPFWQGARRFIPAAVVGFLANNVALAGLVAATGDSYAWLKIAIAILVIPPATFAYAYFFAYRN